mmetsp:Transcript_43701/g.111714  ORF Transcript_43701/g.111714 Transcript_43701/m.111714 type:complete len:187 (+) Transcript_43701:207-767(+)
MRFALLPSLPDSAAALLLDDSGDVGEGSCMTPSLVFARVPLFRCQSPECELLLECPGGCGLSLGEPGSCGSVSDAGAMTLMVDGLCFRSETRLPLLAERRNSTLLPSDALAWGFAGWRRKSASLPKDAPCAGAPRTFRGCGWRINSTPLPPWWPVAFRISCVRCDARLEPSVLDPGHDRLLDVWAS